MAEKINGYTDELIINLKDNTSCLGLKKVSKLKNSYIYLI